MAQLLEQYVWPNVLDASTRFTLQDFVVTVWLAVALLVLRYVAEAVLLPPTRKWLKAKSQSPKVKEEKGLKRLAFTVFDCSWIAAFAAILDVLAWYVTLAHNGDCTPLATKPCFAGWPNHSTNQYQRWFLLLMASYYVSEVIGTWVGVGTRLKADMMTHHFVTLALIAIAYVGGLHRMSVMWQALFDISNPVLHAAKALHTSGVESLAKPKWLLFNAFALCFFLFRVVAGPYSILYPSFAYTWGVLPPSWCYTCWALMAFLYGLQLVWFYKIVQLATNPKAAEKEE